MSIVDDRGLFWWSDLVLPADQFAPDSSVPGRLRISDHGRIELDLDGILPNELGPWAVFTQLGKTSSRGICGKLKTSNDYVVLADVIADGGRLQTAGISHERYFASHALIGSDVAPPANEPPMLDTVQVDLQGLEDWVGLRSIETTRTPTEIDVKYRQPQPIQYALDDGELSIKFFIAGPFEGQSHSDELTLKQGALVRLCKNDPISLEETKGHYGQLCDLLVLLTGSDYSLDWPTVIDRVDRKYKFYFGRQRFADVEPPQTHHCWTHFPRLQDRFGSIFSKFRDKVARLGPAIHLYLANRRLSVMYVEHKFVNMIWGLESLHRRTVEKLEQTTPLKEKIERILAVLKGDDRRWLRYQLRNAHEPSLEERLRDVLGSIEMPFEPQALRAFCHDCADRRNDISHFGGLRRDGNYAAFVIDLNHKCIALGHLYHAVLLHEIGIDLASIKWFLLKGPQSGHIIQSFVAVALLAENTSIPQ